MLNRVVGLSNPADKGYFRFLDNNDAKDDEPHDEHFSFIPDFIPYFHTLGYPKISTDPYIEKDYFDAGYDILLKYKEVMKKVPMDRYDLSQGDKLADDDDDDDDVPVCIVLESKSGAQLWGMVVPFQGIFTGMFPHYLGKSRVKLCILSSPTNRGWDPQKQREGVRLPFGSVGCTFDPSGNALEFLKTDEESLAMEGITVMDSATILPGEGCVSMGKAFVLPDAKELCIILHFHCHNLAFKKDSRNTPYAAVAQLTGFADKDVFCYDSYEEFDIWSKSLVKSPVMSGKFRKKVDAEDTRFYSEFFGTDPKKFEKQDKHALIFGHVIETELKTNEHTGKKFVWALIRTCGGMEIDVVFRQSLLEHLKSPMPKVGGILRGHFWLSGVLMLDDGNEYM